MRKFSEHRLFHTFVAVLMLGPAVSALHADPITVPGYTVTDLGAGTPTISNGLLTAPNGQIYEFPQTPNTTLTPGQGTMANFPQLVPPSRGNFDYGNPAFDFSYVTNALMNSSGVVAATNVQGVAGHEYNQTEFLVQRNADGTWGQPVLAYSQSGLFVGFGGQFSVVGLSKANEVLIQNDGSDSNVNQSLVYNLNTHTLTDLQVLLTSANLNYFGLNGLAIDDAGRILLQAEYFDPDTGFTPTNLLLTPTGVSSEPLEVAAPEPSTLAFMLLAIAGVAMHRLHERHRSTT